MAGTKAVASKAASENVSLALSDFSAGGGIFPPGRYRVDEAVFVEWDYDGQGPPTLSMRLKATSLDPDSGVTQLTQHYSMGTRALTCFTPNEDNGNHTLKRIPGAVEGTGPTKGSNFHIFIQNLLNSGFPQNVWDAENSIAVIEGMEASFVHVALKEFERKGSGTGDPTATKKKNDYAKTIPVVSGDIVLPGEKRAGSAPSKAAAAKQEDPIDQLTADLSKVLSASPAGIGLSKARVLIFNAHREAKLPPAFSTEVLAGLKDDAILQACLPAGYNLVGTEIQRG